MTEDVIEKKRDLIRRIDRFPYEIINRLLLVERYFQKMEDLDDAEFRFAEIAIDENQFNSIKNTVWQEGKNVFVYGRAEDCLCMPVDDLFVIYNTITDVLTKAKNLVEIQSNTPHPHRKEVQHD